MATALPASPPRTTLRRSLLTVTDAVPQTYGAGVVFIKDGRLERLRGTGASGVTVVYELRLRSVASQFQAPPLLRAPAPRLVAPRLSARPSPARTATSSPATEWMNLGFNCGGAALAWVGVVSMSALAPVTGGASGFAAAFLYGGAIAATGQCAVSMFRTTNVHTGRTTINERLDESALYIRMMRGADTIGLLSAGGALKGLKTTHSILSAKGFTWSYAARGPLSRPSRRQLTAAFGLEGARRVAGPTINQFVRQKLLEGVAGVVGLTGSALGGNIKEMVVWIVGAPGDSP